MTATDPSARLPVWALAVRTLGEILVTAGVVLLLFGFYALVWTNVQANATAAAEVRDLRRDFAPGNSAKTARMKVGDGDSFALLFLPKLGAEWVQPVVRGSGTTGTGIRMRDLIGGIAHYPRTAMPGARGNFALAGHRATHGEPFRDLDRLARGDLAVVQTAEGWFTYEVTGSEIVPASAVDVLLPVPRRAGRPADRARMTLTTCHPRWGSESRLIVHTELRERRAPADPPPGF